MKIRTCFVSNSSTTSFLIYGVEIEPKDVKKAKEIGLGVYYGDPWSNYVYAGISWDKVGDYETGLEFKQKIEKLVEQINPEYKCKTISEAYYDG